MWCLFLRVCVGLVIGLSCFVFVTAWELCHSVCVLVYYYHLYVTIRYHVRCVFRSSCPRTRKSSSRYKRDKTKTNQTIKVRRSINTFFQCIAKDSLMLYFVILGYAIQKRAVFTQIWFQDCCDRQWPMPVPPHGGIWDYPFDEMADDGCTMMEKFLASLGLMDSHVGCICQVPATMVVNKRTRNVDVVRNRMPWWKHECMPAGTQCAIDLPLIMEDMSLEYFVDADLPWCEECLFLSRKLYHPHNIWVERAGGYFYGLKTYTDRNGEKVEAKKLCGSQDHNKIWHYHNALQVTVGFRGWHRGQFSWHLDGYRLVAGVGVRVPCSDGDVIFPVYIQMLRP